MSCRPAICTLIGWVKSSCLFISLSGFCERSQTLSMIQLLLLLAHLFKPYLVINHNALYLQTLRDMRDPWKWKLSYFFVGDTVQTVEEFKRTNITVNLISEEFEKVNRTRPELSQGDCAGGHRVENRNKNRSVLVLPPDTHRPYITSFQVRHDQDQNCIITQEGHIIGHVQVVFTQIHIVREEWNYDFPLCIELPNQVSGYSKIKGDRVFYFLWILFSLKLLLKHIENVENLNLNVVMLVVMHCNV